MAEGTYEYECMRAELLGMEKPDYEEFVKRKMPESEEGDGREDVEVEHLRQNEQLGHVGGKLNELNTILRSTQRKINTFAAPLARFLRIKGDGASSGQEECAPPGSSVPASSDPTSTIDDLLDKFDRAEVAISQQNKQMKKLTH